MAAGALGATTYWFYSRISRSTANAVNYAWAADKLSQSMEAIDPKRLYTRGFGAPGSHRRNNTQQPLKQLFFGPDSTLVS